MNIDSSRKLGGTKNPGRVQRATSTRRQLIPDEPADTQATTAAIQRMSRLQVTLKSPLEQSKAFEIGGEFPARVTIVLSKQKNLFFTYTFILFG